jgi:2-phospho-L-lactate guanylyltransferase (CobY/MobA/RfbA family)
MIPLRASWRRVSISRSIADDNSGETNAIEVATAVCIERGAASTLVVPADIPLIDSSELQQIVDSAPPTRRSAGAGRGWARHERSLAISG